VDARRAKAGVALASEEKGPARTAAEWCRKARLAVAINAGMFQTDQRSNVGRSPTCWASPRLRDRDTPDSLTESA
jgi:hypothetical protein